MIPLVPVSRRCKGQASPAFLAAIDKALSVNGGDRLRSVAAWREMLEETQKRAEDWQEEAPKPRSKRRSRPEAETLDTSGDSGFGSLSLVSWYVFQGYLPGEVNGQEEVDIYEEALYALSEADDPQPLKDFVARYPNSRYVPQAEKLILSSG